ncbi:serine/threonine protein kinase, partial [Frankia sp. AgKG'84/4]|nr:serine/threonine protein kinase [Frankia sp. AgKG'84/4]
ADEAASTPPGPTTPAPGAASHDPTASPVANQSPEQIWRGVLGALNMARSRAFEQAKESLLAESDAPGSPAYNADVALMRQVVSLGAHSSPLRTVVDALEVRTDTADRTVLRITDHLDAYDYFDAGGRVVAHKDAKAPQRRDLVLVRTASGWRVSDTVPITAG